MPDEQKEGIKTCYFSLLQLNEMANYVRSSLTHFGQGMLMGGSDAIPGVSGGTMALIVGIYRRLIDSISSFVSMTLAVLTWNREEMARHFGEVEWRLIVPLGVGILVAFGVATVVIPTLLERYPEQMRGLFFGLVAASIAIPWMGIRRPKAWHGALVVAFAVAAYVLVGLPQQSAADPSLVRIFLSVSVAICAMILPGVSGAYLLHAMGIYEVTFEHIGNLEVLYIAVFLGGAVFGLGTFAKLLDWLLKTRHDATMAALTGLMAGGLRALWPWQSETRALLWPGAGDPVWPVLGLGALGFLLIAVLTWLGSRRIEEDEAMAEAG
jgi:putative membrane protein